MMNTFERVTWIKNKHAAPKTRGRYSGGTNSAPLKRRKKQGGSKIKPTTQRVMVIRDTGKIAWTWRTI